MIRNPVVAGMFYPDQPGRLSAMVKGFISSACIDSDPAVTGIVSPHAGYIYSGAVAGSAFAAAPEVVDTIVVLAPAHRFPVDGASVFDGSGYRTPLGVAGSDRDVIDRLESGGIHFEPAAHGSEHSAEVQIPFIQTRWPSASIVILLIGRYSSGFPGDLAEKVNSALEGRENTLLVASSDLSHYHSIEDARKMDRRVIEAFCSGDPAALEEVLSNRAEACGGGPMLTLMHYGILSGSDRFREISYDTSATASGDSSAVVGYFAGSLGRGGS